MHMRKIAFFETILVSLFLLCTSSCASDTIYLTKPTDTNLAFWITEEVSASDFDDCTFLPGGFGVDCYLDSRYIGIDEDDGGMVSAPDIAVVYHVTGYPDLIDSKAVTMINITDPDIFVYGLTMLSLLDDVTSTMVERGFKVNQENEHIFVKKNIRFSFGSQGINIYAEKTNKTGIVY